MVAALASSDRDQGRRPCLSVFQATRTPVKHGRMTDRVSSANCRQRSLGRSAAIWPHGAGGL